MDQIAFQIPASAPHGCYVPVTVVLDGIPSNHGAISVGEDEFCGDVNSFSAAETQAIAGDANFRFGRIDLRAC